MTKKFDNVFSIHWESGEGGNPFFCKADCNSITVTGILAKILWLGRCNVCTADNGFTVIYPRNGFSAG